jgi:lipid II:glycine glycyltransferase (peptidoglycan interpeptide bridge formation enzyme)
MPRVASRRGWLVSAADGVPTGDAWDRRVRANPLATYLQTTAWAEVKRSTGWRPRLVVGTTGEDVVGAQVLVRRLPLVPFDFGYAPRGPLPDEWTTSALVTWTERVRGEGQRGAALDRVALLRMDPEVEEGTDLDDGRSVEATLTRLGWRRAADVQPRSTRIIDLRQEEAALWADLRGKWRQYVNRARTLGVMVREVDAAADPDAFATFYRVMRETSERAGVPIRTESTYRTLWAAFQPATESRLLFADDAAGNTVAVLLLVSCGGRVVEPYGGMTTDGATLRANYLLKWEAIRSSHALGATSYDLWGLVHPGIRQFKEGFGGREVNYIGAWDLTLSPAGATLLRLGEAVGGPARRLLRGVERWSGETGHASDRGRVEQGRTD